MKDADLKVLLQRAGLDLNPEEFQWVSRAFAEFHPQLEDLLSLELDSEEVGTAFMLGPPES